MAQESNHRPGMPVVLLGGREIGLGQTPFVIAELSANHGGSIEQAERVVALAAEAGADAVKLQTFTPDSMTLDLAEPPFIVGTGTAWEGRTLHDLYVEAQTPWEWHQRLFRVAEDHGLLCFSSPFDRDAVDFLETFDPPAHKIASFEILDHALIAHAASTGRPLIISTGMASAEEIDDAVAVAREAGRGGVVLLRCNSAYPAAPSEMDLATIPEMARRWNAPVGLSDHTIGSTAAVVATALGACVIEKHLIADRADGGPDSGFSAQPEELAALVSDVAEVSAIRGGIRFGPSPSETPSLAFRRSLYVVADVRAGETFTEENVRAIRPGGGLSPKHLSRVIGRRAAADVVMGTALTDDLLA